MGWWRNNGGFCMCVCVSWVKWSWIYFSIYKPEGLWLSSSWLFMWQMDKRNPRFICPFQPPGKINQLSRKKFEIFKCWKFYLSFLWPSFVSFGEKQNIKTNAKLILLLQQILRSSSLCRNIFFFFLVFSTLRECMN